MPASKLLTLPEAAVRLGVAHGTLIIQARRGKLRAKKYGPVWLVEEREVTRYGVENRRGVGSSRSADEAFETELQESAARRPLSPERIAAAFDLPVEAVTSTGPDYAAHKAAQEERAAFVRAFGSPKPAPKPSKRHGA